MSVHDNMIAIKKIEDKEIDKTMKSLEGFHPVVCKECKSKENFSIKLFIPSRNPDNTEEFESVRKNISEYGVRDFGVYNTGRRSIIVTALCNDCKSDRIIWDYCDDCEWVKKRIK